jgi:hypothetical protein
MSLTAKLKQLLLLEKDAVSNPQDGVLPGSAKWIAEGMDIELFQ